MPYDTLNVAVEEIIRRSEVIAVVRELRAGHAPRLGQAVEYTLEPQEHSAFQKKMRPYRVDIQQWHLDAAARMIAQGHITER